MIQTAEQIANECLDYEYMIQEIMKEIIEDIFIIDLYPRKWQRAP